MTHDCSGCPALFLCGVQQGGRVRILEITGACELRRQLARFGIRRGDCVLVKRRAASGTLLIEHQGVSVALDKDYAAQIRVEFAT